MGTWASYEEKEYETLANVAFVTELAHRGSPVQVFSPGQVLEATLGFDFSTRLDPSSSLFRRLFDSTPGAPGISQSQSRSARIPLDPSTRLLNLFLQYKRPELFKKGHRSKLWPKDENFMRFTVSENRRVGGQSYAQVQALHRLEELFGQNAVVRYACPSAPSRGELYRRFREGELLTSSVFVPPSNLLRTSPGDFHRRWTFQPSDLGTGRPNPDGERRSSESGDHLLRGIESRRQSAVSLSEFPIELRRGAEAARGIEHERTDRTSSRPNRVRRIHESEQRNIEREMFDASPPIADAIASAIEIAFAARDLDAKWMIVAID